MNLEEIVGAKVFFQFLDSNDHAVSKYGKLCEYYTKGVLSHSSRYYMHASILNFNISNFYYFSYFLDFNDTTPPKHCGYDEKTGDDKLCCSDFTLPFDSLPQPPKYPIDNPKLFECIDLTPECSRWAKDHPESCSIGHDSYEFMRSACQKSCGRCESNVSFISVLT